VKILHLDLAKERQGVDEYEDRIINLEKEISSQHQALRLVKIMAKFDILVSESITRQ
jgi:hypothetical protein